MYILVLVTMKARGGYQIPCSILRGSYELPDMMLVMGIGLESSSRAICWLTGPWKIGFYLADLSCFGIIHGSILRLNMFNLAYSIY